MAQDSQKIKIGFVTVDDASTDNTKDVVKYNIDKRIVYVRQDTINGPATARNISFLIANQIREMCQK